MEVVHTYRGPIPLEDLGSTLIHEHIFVRNPELETSLPDDEWNPNRAVEQAVQGLTDLLGRRKLQRRRALTAGMQLPPGMKLPF